MKKNVGKCLGSIASALFVWIVYYFTLPPLSISYYTGFLFLSFVLLVLIVNIIMWCYTSTKNMDTGLTIFCISLTLIAVLVSFFSSTWFNANKMHNQLGNPVTIEFNEMINQIDTSQIPIVDNELAQKQADKKIGEDVALGSRAKLGEAKVQEVNGEIMYVAPLEHSGFFKWFKHKTTPGYITVSATNQNKVNYVTKVDDDTINVAYSESAYWSKNLKRHLRNNGYRSVGLTEYTFEIDDSGIPFWVVTTYENTTFWNNPEATGVVIVDAQTGDSNWYSLEEIPDWVDIVQPESFIEDQIDNWGKLVHGAFNFSGEDKIQKTDLVLTVYVNGECYYFTGMTSVGSDESCVGFIMVNTRDKSSMISYMSGATETAAMKSAEGIVANYGYISTEPLPLNINGIPTYVMALKDSEGLVKSYAMVNVELYNIVAKGDTLQETSRAYIQAVAKSGHTDVVGSDEAFGYTLKGTVERISAVVEDNSTCYYIIIQNEDDKIFTASYLTSDELPITRDGDKVQIEYVDDGNGTIDILTFDNLEYGANAHISEEQEHRNQLDEGSSALESNYNEIIKVNPEMTEEKWNALSEEEKAKIISDFLKEDK